jgi:hypothetical protein
VKINPDSCVGCGECLPYCPVQAISLDDVAKINDDECTECGACKRAAVCATDAFEENALEWPRSIRRSFSAVTNLHKDTRVPGRGTEEAKTNDVTGTYRKGVVGLTAEMGRPGVGVRFKDVEKVAMAMAKAGVQFADKNPVTFQMLDKKTGKLNPEILNEKALSAMIESVVTMEQLPQALKNLQEVKSKINTVFSLDIVAVMESDGTMAVDKILKDMNLKPYVDGKNNLGLGKPLFKEGK